MPLAPDSLKPIAHAPAASTVVPPKSGLLTATAAHRDLLLLAAALGVSGFVALRPLAVEWSVNPQYSYGWTVPFLALYLFFRQWMTRPPARAPSAGSSMRFATIAACAGLLLAQLPLRWLQEANPDWRPLGSLVAGDFVALALLTAFLLGGGPWLRQFAFPALFLLVAVPWPERFETACVQELMRVVTAAVVESLDWFGIAAVQQGNLIQVSSGLIGVEEACSGIRSLQSTLMISLFLGQFYALPWGRRALLVGIGGILAMLTNLARALFLVLVSVRAGKEAFARWHDSAGLWVLVACLLGLWLVAVLLKPRLPSHGKAAADARGLSVTTEFFRLPRAALVCVLLWPLGVEAAVNGWYRARENANHYAAEPITWSVRWPTAAAGFRELEIPEISRAMLRFTEGRAAAWNETNGERWSAFFSRWEAGRSAAPAAKMHNPRVCLSASGRQLLRELGAREIIASSGVSLPMHGYVFDAGAGRELYVFYGLWEDRRPAETVMSRDDKNQGAADTTVGLVDDELTARGRVRAALAGRRNLGQRVLEVSVLGPTDDTSAWSRLQSRLPELVQRP